MPTSSPGSPDAPDPGPIVPIKPRRPALRRRPAQYYLPDDIQRQIADIAAATGQSKSEVARHLLTWALQHYQGPR